MQLPKLWLLTALHVPATRFDVMDAVVVRAPTPHAARRMAAYVKGDEGADTWTDASRSSCTRLWDEGKPGVVLRDYKSG